MSTPPLHLFTMMLALLVSTACAKTAAAQDAPSSPSNQTAVLDTVMDRWHRAAATADSAAFFGTMSQDGIYLGTDRTGRWTRDSMARWAAPYFRRDTAWAFTPVERYWYFAEDGRTAWFEEHLDSPHMGVVRGSGVLTKVPEGASSDAGYAWHLRHYNLALAVPNEAMDAVQAAIDTVGLGARQPPKQ